VDAKTARRLVRAYGTRAEIIARGDIGTDLGGGLSEAKVDYLVREEFAMEPEDILWRRSKLGLHLPRETAIRLARQLARGDRGGTESRRLPCRAGKRRVKIKYGPEPGLSICRKSFCCNELSASWRARPARAAGKLFSLPRPRQGTANNPGREWQIGMLRVRCSRRRPSATRPFFHQRSTSGICCQDGN
jgi:hypothetical protein